MLTTRQDTSTVVAQFQTPLGVQALTLLAVIIGWEFIGHSGLLFPDLFPSIVEILPSLWTYLITPVMIPHIKASLYEVGGAIAIASIFGVPLGILWGSKQSWLEIVEPLILYAAVVPKIVIFPVFILFFGIDVHSKLAVGAIAAFFPVSLLTIAGMREVKKVYVDVARTIGATPMQIAKNVYLPAIAGQVFTGIRIGLGAAVTGALLAETKIAKAGLGFMIVEYYGQFRIADMYALLLFIFILAAIVNWAMKSLFGWLSPISRRSGDAGMYF